MNRPAPCEFGRPPFKLIEPLAVTVPLLRFSPPNAFFEPTAALRFTVLFGALSPSTLPAPAAESTRPPKVIAEPLVLTELGPASVVDEAE